MYSGIRRVENAPEESDSEYFPLQSSSTYNPLNYVPPTVQLMNGFTAVRQSIDKLSPSRLGAMRMASLPTVPEASDEGSDRQSISTTTTDTVVEQNTRQPARFTEHSIQEVRRIRPETIPEDPFLEVSPGRDPRSIAYRFAHNVFNANDTDPSPHTPPRPLSQYSQASDAYASGVSRSPTPARDNQMYRRVYDEEQPPPIGATGVDDDEDDDETYEDDDATYEDDEETYEDGKDEDLVDQYLQPYAMRDAEKYSLASSNSSAFAAAWPASPGPTRHFGPAPAGRVHRRNKMMKLKTVPLTNGNVVVDLDCPPKLVKVLPTIGGVQHGEHGEMTKMRYTMVTSDPDDFSRQGFFLRQNEMRRTTELCIVITMYNEDEVLFCRTLYGVMRNISHLCSRKNSRTWGQDAWKKVVVCIVSDGRRKIHPRVLDVLTLLGVYQPGPHMKTRFNDKPVTAHLFEYTTTFGLDANLHFRYPDKGVVPTQILFCMKEKNQKKINSHRWAFNAFCPLLQPNVVVLLDVGTMPTPKSIYHLWKTFDLNSNVGGACGEIAAYKGKYWYSLLNPLVASQNFEYKIANILDKPTESLFGYISVLPGAFSAYRYIALQNNTKGVGPLASYFKGEVLHGRDTDIFTSNMYLAEDRILCFELIAKADQNWVLKYVPGAVGETDVPDTLPEFISQRRRWLNGSFFAATYAIAHGGQILRSGHSAGRKFSLMCETLYNIINLIASWFAIGNFYLFFVILTSSLETQFPNTAFLKYWNAFIQYFMGGLVVSAFLVSMGNNPKAAKWKYMTLTILFGISMAYLLFCAIMCAIRASTEGDSAYSVMLFSIIVTYGVYLFASILCFDPWHMLTSFIPYMLLSPMYINILNVYAFCNLDDISWGTKQDTIIEPDLGAVIQNSNSQVNLEVLADVADADEMYEESLTNIRNRKPLVKKPKTPPKLSSAEQEAAAKDYYASVRTNVLLAWVLSNGCLLALILGGGDPSSTFAQNNTFTRTKAYMTFILAFVAITSIVRFAGSTMYLIARVFTG